MKLGLVVLGGLARNPAHGTIPVLHWLVERLARRHDLRVFTLYGAPVRERYSIFGADVHHAGAPGASRRTFFSLLREHRRSRFDILHAFWLLNPGAIAVAAGRWLGVPTLVHVAGGELVRFPDIGYGRALSRRDRVLGRLALRGAHLLSAASTPMVREIERLGCAAEKIALGVDLARWTPASPRRRETGRPARLVHVASLNRVKDQVTLLHAAARLRNAGVSFTLDIIGPDTLDGAVQRLASQLELSNHVRFQGWTSHETLRAQVAAADLMWISSRHEAGPLAMLEAAVVGVPVVGTAVGHVAEWAPDAAIAVPVQDADALARETRALLDDEDRRLRLAAEARRRALACDADWTVRRFEELYDRLLTEARRKGPSR